MPKNQSKLSAIWSSIWKSLLISILVTLVVSIALGYKYSFVLTGSSEPNIHARSIIITTKTDLKNLHEGDYIMFKQGDGYITHRIIAIKRDGYFQKGEEFIATVNGEKYKMVYGAIVSKGKDNAGKDLVLGVDEEVTGTLTFKNDIVKNCNIIAMQQGQPNADKNYVNYEKNFVGQVIYTNYPIGLTIDLLKNNPLIMVGLIGCFALLIIYKDQTEISVQY